MGLSTGISSGLSTSLSRGLGSASGGAATATPPVLDNITSAVLAFSVARKLRTAYSGNCIRVRRSSDSAEQDIGFSDNVLDSASLLSFCGAGNGFVVKVYDQSGHVAAKDLEQATTTLQPQIVTSGALTLNNLRPYMLGGSDDFLELSAWDTRPADAHQIVVVKQNVGTFITDGSVSGGTYGLIGQDGNATSQNAHGSPDLYVNGGFIGAHATLTRNSVHDAVAVNTPTIVRNQSASYSNANYASYRTAYDAVGSFPMFDEEAERIIVTDAAEISAVETNLAAFYGITLV